MSEPDLNEEADIWVGEDGEDIVTNLLDTAKACRVSKPTLQSWISQGCPCRETGGNGKAYKLFVPEVREWRAAIDRKEAIEESRRKAAIAQAELDLDDGATEEALILSAKARREYAQTELVTNKARRERGELVPAILVYEEFEKIFRYLAQNLQGLPDRCQRQLGLKDPQVLELTSIVDEWQAELAKNLTTVEGTYKIDEEPSGQN